MESTSKYVFLGFVVLVLAGLGGIWLYTRSLPPPEPPLTGAGSTFVALLMVQWSDRYERTERGCRVGYKAIGSGAGIKYITEQRSDFACSDAPMTDAQLDAARERGGEVVHVPLVLGAVVPVYNVPGVGDDRPLRFTGLVLADIHLGKVKRWNDPALRALNPGVELPTQDIAVVHRADGSGTTWIWVDYLSKVSPEWKAKVGAGTKVEWPVGAGEQGNEGVAEKVKKTPGSFGYVELTYAYRLELATGLVRNREGEFVRGKLSAVTAAAANALQKIPDDLRFSLTDAQGKGSYPISGATWALVRLGRPAGKQARLADFLRWAIGPGQDHVQDLLYARLPEPLVRRADEVIDRIEAGR